MEDIKNTVKIVLVSQYGTLKPIKLVISKSSFALLEKAVLELYYSVSDIAERELNGYKKGSKQNFLGTDFIFSKSQCVRIKRHEIPCESYTDRYIGFCYV